MSVICCFSSCAHISHGWLSFRNTQYIQKLNFHGYYFQLNFSSSLINCKQSFNCCHIRNPYVLQQSVKSVFYSVCNINNEMKWKQRNIKCLRLEFVFLFSISWALESSLKSHFVWQLNLKISSIHPSGLCDCHFLTAQRWTGGALCIHNQSQGIEHKSKFNTKQHN